jgi:hypothetical protein
MPAFLQKYNSRVEQPKGKYKSGALGGLKSKRSAKSFIEPPKGFFSSFLIVPATDHPPAKHA